MFFKKGDKVYCSCHNKVGTIIEKKDFNWLYNILVEFSDKTEIEYTYDGRLNLGTKICIDYD